MTEFLTPKQRIVQAIGYIVLSSQELERSLRLLGAFAGGGDWIEKLERHQHLTKQTLGKNVKNLISHASGDVDAFSAYVYQVVHNRNAIVHHYFDTFADELAAGDHDAIADALENKLDEMQKVSDAFKRSLGELADAIESLDGVLQANN